MRRAFSFLVILVGIVAVALWLKGNATGLTPPSAIENRISKLKKEIAEQESESVLAFAKYAPTSKTHIDDLNSPVVDILRQLPGVVQVEVGVHAKKPTSRLIHLRDWHRVPKDLYALEMNHAHGGELTVNEIDLLHEQLLLEVELVQIEQMALLRCLIKHHGLKRVFSEGFSLTEMKNYREKIAVLRKMEAEEIPQVRNQLADVRKIVGDSTGERKEKAQAIETELAVMLDQHNHRLLEMGASGRLLIASELEDVLPIEDTDALQRAKLITPSGKVKLDPQKLEARHDAQVKAAMKDGQVAVIILGGAHDLSDSVRRLGGGTCEYLRVTTKRQKEISE